MIDYDEYICGDKFKNVFEKNLNIVYSKIDFVKKCNPRCKFIITHNGDKPVTDEIINYFPNLKNIFGQNIMTKSNKAIPIPIGLENDYVKGQPERKKVLFKKSNSNVQPNRLIYLNCNIKTYKNDRQTAYNYFSNVKWCTVDQYNNVKYLDYINNILDHHFCVSPRGNGLDCHRTWEILYLNRYPIMKKYHGLELLYKDFPVVFIDDWCDITEDFLNKQLIKIKNTCYDKDKFKFSYWKNLIEKKLIQ